VTGDTANRRTGELGNSRYRQFRELPIRSLSSGNKLKPRPEGTGCREVHRMYRVGSGVLNQRHGGGCGIKAACRGQQCVTFEGGHRAHAAHGDDANGGISA
jgi:hypothetical protein